MRSERILRACAVALLMGGAALSSRTTVHGQETPGPATPSAQAPAVTPTAAVTPTPAGAVAPGAPVKAPAAAKSDAPPLCADCHEDQGKAFPGNPHTRIPGIAFGKAGSENLVCAKCHGEGAVHMESCGEDKSDIRVFKGRAGADFCLTCHKSLKEHASFRTGPPEGINCLTCHSVHAYAPKAAHLLKKAPLDLCASCHPSRAAAFREKPFAHRLGRGGMDCTSCHDPHGLPENHGVRLTRFGQLPCVNCHAEKKGPFVFEHGALFAGNCLSCHEPHGSSNRKMLIRARVDQLCLECHSTLSMKTLGSQPPSIHNLTLPRWRNCTTCHPAIHGSNVSPQLFK